MTNRRYNVLRVKLLIIGVLCVLCTVKGLTQITNLQGKILDDQSEEPLMYAHVFAKSSKEGTISNEQGEFILKVNLMDTLRISYIGYKTQYIPVKNVHIQSEIYLKSEGNELPEIMVIANDEFLYSLIDDSRKKLKNQKATFSSKTYMNVISNYENQPVEFVECYYNADVSSSKVKDLNIKNGRSLIKTYANDGFYLSMNTSKAISMLSITKEHDRMPVHPFHLSKRKNKKRFYLQKFYQSENIIGISFTPKKEKEKCFSGKLWINEKTKTIQKIELISERIEKSIIVGLGFDKVQDIQFNLNYSFTDHEDQQVLNFIDMSYDLNLETNHASIDSVESMQDPKVYNFKTKGILYFYNYNHTFDLPKYDFEHINSDYRFLSFLPYNTHFWNQHHGMQLTDEQLKTKAYLEENGVHFKDNTLVYDQSERAFFQSTPILWSENERTFLRPTIEKKKRVSISRLYTENIKILSDQLNIDVQLFLDINPYPDTTQYTIANVLNPFRSYNYLDNDPMLHCYINIYFDIGEIYKRKLYQEIEASDKRVPTIEFIFDKLSKELRSEHKQLEDEAFAGMNKKKLIKWNEKVKQELSIDNIELFDPKKSNEPMNQTDRKR